MSGQMCTPSIALLAFALLASLAQTQFVDNPVAAVSEAHWSNEKLANQVAKAVLESTNCWSAAKSIFVKQMDNKYRIDVGQLKKAPCTFRVPMPTEGGLEKLMREKRVNSARDNDAAKGSTRSATKEAIIVLLESFGPFNWVVDDHILDTKIRRRVGDKEAPTPPAAAKTPNVIAQNKDGKFARFGAPHQPTVKPHPATPAAVAPPKPKPESPKPAFNWRTAQWPPAPGTPAGPAPPPLKSALRKKSAFPSKTPPALAATSPGDMLKRLKMTVEEQKKTGSAGFPSKPPPAPAAPPAALFTRKSTHFAPPAPPATFTFSASRTPSQKSREPSQKRRSTIQKRKWSSFPTNGTTGNARNDMLNELKSRFNEPKKSKMDELEKVEEERNRKQAKFVGRVVEQKASVRQPTAAAEHNRGTSTWRRRVTFAAGAAKGPFKIVLNLDQGVHLLDLIAIYFAGLKAFRKHHFPQQQNPTESFPNLCRVLYHSDGDHGQLEAILKRVDNLTNAFGQCKEMIGTETGLTRSGNVPDSDFSENCAYDLSLIYILSGLGQTLVKSIITRIQETGRNIVRDKILEQIYKQLVERLENPAAFLVKPGGPPKPDRYQTEKIANIINRQRNRLWKEEENIADWTVVGVVEEVQKALSFYADANIRNVLGELNQEVILQTFRIESRHWHTRQALSELTICGSGSGDLVPCGHTVEGLLAEESIGIQKWFNYSLEPSNLMDKVWKESRFELEWSDK